MLSEPKCVYNFSNIQNFQKVTKYNLVCFVLIWASGGISVIQHRPAPSCMSHMGARADMPWENNSQTPIPLNQRILNACIKLSAFRRGIKTCKDFCRAGTEPLCIRPAREALKYNHLQKTSSEFLARFGYLQQKYTRKSFAIIEDFSICSCYLFFNLTIIHEIENSIQVISINTHHVKKWILLAFWMI